MGKEADAGVYDEIYATESTYSLPVAKSFYYPMFLRVVSEVRNRNLRSIIEVGCGNGALGGMLMTGTTAAYRGFDFSPVAVQSAIRRTGRAEAFFVSNALDPRSYEFVYDGVVCTEVLEHITQDLDVISLWKPDAQCICSVPNFDYPTHVRHFRHEDEVRARYSALIRIDRIVRVPKPVIKGKTMGEYLRQLRWAREEPTKLLGLIGINRFDWHAGWFIFTGLRGG